MRVAGAFFLVTALFVSAPARAQLSETDQRARVLFEAGMVHYDSGEYERALEQFEAAYELSQRPALLYNIGLTRERIGNLEGALEAFRAFLAAGGVTPNVTRESLERRVQALERRIERQRTVPTPTEVAQQAVTPTEPNSSAPAAATGGSDDGLIIGVTVGAIAAVAIAAVIIGVVLALPGEQPYQGTLFSRRLP